VGVGVADIPALPTTMDHTQMVVLVVQVAVLRSAAILVLVLLAKEIMVV